MTTELQQLREEMAYAAADEAWEAAYKAWNVLSNRYRRRYHRNIFDSRIWRVREIKYKQSGIVDKERDDLLRRRNAAYEALGITSERRRAARKAWDDARDAVIKYHATHLAFHGSYPLTHTWCDVPVDSRGANWTDDKARATCPECLRCSSTYELEAERKGQTQAEYEKDWYAMFLYSRRGRNTTMTMGQS